MKDNPYFTGDVASCNEGLVACPHGDGTYRCVNDTVGCGKQYSTFEHVREKRNYLGFRPGPTQTGLYNLRYRL